MIYYVEGCHLQLVLCIGFIYLAENPKSGV